jgi:hypothetical protein
MRAPKRSVTVALRALGCGAAFALATCAQSAPTSSPAPAATGPSSSSTTPPPRRGTSWWGPFSRPPQSATLDFGARGGFEVSVFSVGKPYTIDPAKLHFVIRPWNATSAPKPFAAQVGAPILDRRQAQPPDTIMAYHLPVVFPARPARPGMYDVTTQVDPGFTRYDDGTELPVDSSPRSDVYWPDEMGADDGLRAARDEFENRTVYGYGGLVISCHDYTDNTYLADVGVPIRSIERRRGVVERMWTGSMTSRGDDRAYSFLAVDPLMLHAEYPPEKWFATGGSGQPDYGAPCPGLTLADPWHIDVTLTTTKPSRLPAGYDRFKIAVGMTRGDVARRRGFPQGYFTRAQLAARSVWEYDDSLMDQYGVTFRNGRVASFSVPQQMP